MATAGEATVGPGRRGSCKSRQRLWEPMVAAAPTAPTAACQPRGSHHGHSGTPSCSPQHPPPALVAHLCRQPPQPLAECRLGPCLLLLLWLPLLATCHRLLLLDLRQPRGQAWGAEGSYFTGLQLGLAGVDGRERVPLRVLGVLPTTEQGAGASCLFHAGSFSYAHLPAHQTAAGLSPAPSPTRRVDVWHHHGTRSSPPRPQQQPQHPPTRCSRA